MTRTQGEAEAILRRVADLDCLWDEHCAEAGEGESVCVACEAELFLERPKRERGFASIVWNRDGWQIVELAANAVRRRTQRPDLTNPRAIELALADWLSGLPK